MTLTPCPNCGKMNPDDNTQCSICGKPMKIIRGWYCTFLWLLTILPFPPLAPFAMSQIFFRFTAVLLLGLFIFLPGLRG